MLRLRSKSAAFGLVEVLVTVAILAVGLLGLSALQNRSIQLVREGDNLATASMIAAEVAKRMMTNNYETSLGTTGYLDLDLNDEVGSDVMDWATDTLSANPNILNCYSASNSESCLAPGGSFAVSVDHRQALANMMLMDQVELRQWAAGSLPEGQIMICFDSAADALTVWDCDDTQSSSYGDSVFTVKVRWRNIYTNELQIYALQFSAQSA